MPGFPPLGSSRAQAEAVGGVKEWALGELAWSKA